MRILHLLFCLSAPALLPHAWAAPVEDPSGFLDALDRELGPPSFERTFACGRSALIRRFNQNCRFECGAEGSFSGCSSICENTRLEFRREIAECTADEATIADGDGSSKLVTRAEFEALRGNLVRKELEELDVFFGLPGTVRLTRLEPAQYAPRAGAMIPAWELTGEYRLPVGATLEFAFTVGRDLPGAAQVLFFKVGATKIYRVLELDPAPVPAGRK